METSDFKFALPIAVVMAKPTAATTSENEQSQIPLRTSNIDTAGSEPVDTVKLTSFDKMSIVNHRVRHECDLCGKCFPTPSKVAEHRRLHTGEKPFHCQYCDDDFKTKKNLQDHIRIHTGEKPYVCTVCGAQFRQSGGLSKHRTKAHGGIGEVRSKKCRQCDEDFPDQKSLMEHRKTHDKMYVCDTCGQRFTRLHQAKVHQRIHTGEKPFPCDYCGKKFYRNTDLRVHVRIHTGEKPYQCEKCALTFSQRKQLVQHICAFDDKPTKEVANNLTPLNEELACDLCDFLTFEPDDLSTHADRHSQTHAENLQCQTCHRIFRTRHALQVHKRTHTGAKPYKCPFCQKSFRQSGHMNEHRKTHTYKESQCSECGESIETYTAHRRHVCGGSNKNERSRQHGLTTDADYAFYKCAACFTTFKSLDDACNHQCVPDQVAQPIIGGTTPPISGTIYLPESLATNRTTNAVGQPGTGIVIADDSTNSVLDLEQFVAAYPDLFASNPNVIVRRVPGMDHEIVGSITDNNTSPSDAGNLTGSIVTLIESGQAISDTVGGSSVDNILSLASNASNTGLTPMDAVVANATASTSVAEREVEGSSNDKAQVVREEGDRNDTMTDDEYDDDEMNEFLSSDADDDVDETENVADDVDVDLDVTESVDQFVDGSEKAVDENVNDEVVMREDIDVSDASAFAHDDQSEAGTDVRRNNDRQETPNRTSTAVHVGESVTACSQCEMTFENVSALREHKKQTHRNEFPCPTCGKTFPLRSKLTRHIQSVYHHRPYKCSKCSLVFSRRIDCQLHVNGHNGVQSFACDSCGRGFSSNRSLLSHQKMAHSETCPFVCETCGERFIYPSHLSRHEINAHTEQTKQVFICQICGQSYSRLAYLTKHMKRHTDQQQPLQCQLCNINCTSKESFDKHMKSHQRERPHKCSFCEKSFARTSTLKQHLDSHTGSRPYACKYCDKRFKQRGHRLEHERTHVGDRPYVCELCGYSSSYRASYVYHMGKKHPGGANGVTVTIEDSRFVLEFESGGKMVAEVLDNTAAGSQVDEQEQEGQQQQGTVVYVCTDQAGSVLGGLHDADLLRIKAALANSEMAEQQFVNGEERS